MGLCPIPISLLPLSHTVSTDHAPRLSSKFYVINAQNSWEPGTPIATLLPPFLETSASPRYLAESTCPGWVGWGIPAHQQSCLKESTISDSPRTQSARTNAKSQGTRPHLRGRGWKARTGPKMRKTRWEPSRSGHRASGLNQPLHPLHVAFAHLLP